MRLQISSAVIIALLIAVTPGVALTLSGQVVDAQTGNPLPDANVSVIAYQNAEPLSTVEPIGQRHLGGTTDLSGRFRIDVGDRPGIYRLLISHLGYREARVETDPAGTTRPVKLEPEAIRGSEVFITAGRGTPGATPGALSNLDHKLVQLANGVQEPPQIAAEVPNATSFGWAGLPIGDTQLRIRGFGSERLSVSVNGVPVNDPEDHYVYWQDAPDMLSNTYDIQVERGVSNILAGAAGMGGGMNLATSDAVAQRTFQVSYQAGTFNTSRRTLLYRSGLVDGSYNFTSRFSRVATDGYRDHSAADMWSYFLSATRYDRNMVTRLQTYGGEEVSDLAFDAVPRDVLDTNRTYNPAAHYGLNYDGERDNFRQPHYVLNHRWRLNNRLSLEQTLFWITGDGYYEQMRLNRKFSEYNLTPFDVIRDDDGNGDLDTVTISRTDLTRRKYVTKDQRGWLPRLSWAADSRTDLEFGLELRGYFADHWGTVVWARELPAGVSPQHEWYRWHGDKDYLGGFANVERRFGERLTVNAGVQARQVSYQVKQVRLGAFQGYRYDADWLFVTPRLGVNFKPNDRTTLYASLATAGQEPIDEQLLNADNPYDKPKFPEFGLKEINPERMVDLEVGGTRRFDRLQAGANVYAMFFTDEIVPTGEWNSDLDEAVMTNAPTSRHLGVELEADWATPIAGLRIKGNLAIDQSTFGDFTYHYFDADWNEHILNLDGNRIALTPDLTANLRATYEYRFATASLQLQHVGKQFLDNREDDDASLDPYTLLNGTLIVKLLPSPARGGEQGGVSISLELRGMNLLDTKYEPFGWVESGALMFIPAAGRSYLAGVTVRL
jgi:iron complex outermembrane receptor protein